MEQMRRELESYSGPVSRTGSPGWAAEFNPTQPAQRESIFQASKAGGFAPDGFNPVEFQRFRQQERTLARMNPAVQNSSVMNGYQRPMVMGYGMNIGMMNSGYRPMDMQQPAEVSMQGKGKGKLVELDEKNWEQQFADMDAAGRADLDEQANEAMEAELNDMDRSVLSETNEFGDFESIWKGIQAENEANRNMVDGEFLADFNHQWDGFDAAGGFRDPQLGNYLFEEDNLFRALADPFSEGVKIMQESGNLSLAALAFEAAVQKDPQHVEAWNLLGSAQAQNEKESPAIRALEQALKIDPSNLEALMGLAVSYTNEGYDATAYRTLERWLSTKYPQIISPDDLSPPNEIGFTDRHQLLRATKSELGSAGHN